MTLNVNSLLCRQYYACCDQTAVVRITQFSPECSPMPHLYAAKFDDEIRRGSPRWGDAQTRGCFRLRDACYISETVRDRA